VAERGLGCWALSVCVRLSVSSVVVAGSIGGGRGGRTLVVIDGIVETVTYKQLTSNTIK